MFTRRQAISGAIAAAVAVAMPRAWARHARGAAISGTPAAANYLGINSEQIYYSTVEQPFLNVMKYMAGGYGYSGLCGPWITSSGPSPDTGEEAYLFPTLDSDGWPTTLTISGIPGGQKFTSLQCQIFLGVWSGDLPPGASEAFPPGPYTMEVQGEFTLSIGNSTGLTVTSGGSYLTASGTQLTSTLPAGQSGTVTFTMGSNGIYLNVTELPSDTNYLKIPYIVESVYVSNYLDGQILHPTYKAAMSANGTGLFSCFRTMGNQNTYQQEYLLAFTADLADGATSGTLSSLTVNGATYSTWPFPTGTKQVVMATGQVVTMSGTYGSASVTWNTALSGAIETSAVGGMAILSLQGAWSERSLLSNASWATPWGVPFEALIQVANELGIDLWTNVPAAVAVIDDTYTTSLANLLYNGTGANITNSNLSTFTGLNSAHKAYIEYSNETWNFGSGYQEANFCEMMGVAAGFYAAQGNNGPLGGQEYYGTQVAGIGDAFYAVYGSAMSARCMVVAMNQFDQAGLVEVMMNTPDWTSRAYTHHIGGWGFAPYFGPTNAGMNSTDAGTIAALGAPTTELLSIAYTNVGASGNTYSSVPSNGFVGNLLAQVASAISAISAQPWASLPVVCYEGGLDLGNYSGNSALTPYLTDLIRVTDTQYLNYDPDHVLSASGTGYLPGLKAAGVSFVNMLNLCGQEWGQLELVTQMAATPPYTDMPRYAGDVAYAQAA